MVGSPAASALACSCRCTLDAVNPTPPTLAAGGLAQRAFGLRPHPYWAAVLHQLEGTMQAGSANASVRSQLEYAQERLEATRVEGGLEEVDTPTGRMDAVTIGQARWGGFLGCDLVGLAAGGSRPPAPGLLWNTQGRRPAWLSRRARASLKPTPDRAAPPTPRPTWRSCCWRAPRCAAAWRACWAACTTPRA